MVNRIREDIAGYELWSTSGSSKRMPDSAHEVPRVGALAQLNSHFDVGKVYSRGRGRVRRVDLWIPWVHQGELPLPVGNAMIHLCIV